MVFCCWHVPPQLTFSTTPPLPTVWGPLSPLDPSQHCQETLTLLLEDPWVQSKEEQPKVEEQEHGGGAGTPGGGAGAQQQLVSKGPPSMFICAL